MSKRRIFNVFVTKVRHWKDVHWGDSANKM